MPTGLVSERTRLTDLGCSLEVVETLQRSRKQNTIRSYERTWRKFTEFAEGAQFHPLQPTVPNVLEFLQRGLEMGLTLGTLKGQVSAISAFSGRRWAVEELVSRFFKAVIRLKPPRMPRFPKWDLPTVLEMLAAEEFAQGQGLSLWKLSLKTSFLIAITTASRVSEMAALGTSEPFTTFFSDRVVLVPAREFLPKVVSKFHLNREVVLPYLRAPGEMEMDPLDVGTTLRTYLEATASCRKSERLFIIPAGKNKGKPATGRTIASWLVKTIKMAYERKGLSVPQRIGAHSTRGMATSWAAAGGMSIGDICKAASWSSGNTFTAHYCLDPAMLKRAQFGRVVLNTAREEK